MQYEINRVLGTVEEMLVDRKHTGIQIDPYETNMSQIFKHSASTDLLDIHIIFNLNNKFKTQDMKKILTSIKSVKSESKTTHIIIVLKDKPSSQNSISNNISDNISFEVFKLAELMINISKHEKVPKHEIISNDDIIKIMKLYHLKSINQLPLILTSDPMARYLGLKSGQVVKITRNSPSAGTYIHYRCCH